RAPRGDAGSLSLRTSIGHRGPFRGLVVSVSSRAPEPAWPDRPPLPRGPVRGPPRAREPGHRAVPRGQGRARPPAGGGHALACGGAESAGTGGGCSGLRGAPRCAAGAPTIAVPPSEPRVGSGARATPALPRVSARVARTSAGLARSLDACSDCIRSTGATLG